jgi:hypothetical protein
MLVTPAAVGTVVNRPTRTMTTLAPSLPSSPYREYSPYTNHPYTECGDEDATEPAYPYNRSRLRRRLRGCVISTEYGGIELEGYQ